MRSCFFVVWTFLLASLCVDGRYYTPLKLVHEHEHRQLGGALAPSNIPGLGDSLGRGNAPGAGNTPGEGNVPGLGGGPPSSGGGPSSGLQGIPLQCATQCNSVLTITQVCRQGDQACFCTPGVANEYQSCLDCLSTFIATDPSLGSSIQQAAQVLNTGCAQAGIVIPAITIPQAASISATPTTLPVPTPPAPALTSSSSLPIVAPPSTSIAAPVPTDTIGGNSGVSINPPGSTNSLPGVIPGISAAGNNPGISSDSPFAAPSAAPPLQSQTSGAEKPLFRISAALGIISTIIQCLVRF